MSLFFKIKKFLTWPYLPDLDLSLHIDSPKWAQIARQLLPSFSTCKVPHKTCAIPLIFVLHMATFCDLTLRWSWPWPEHSIKYWLFRYLPLSYRSIWRKFWPRTANFEISTTSNLKVSDFSFDLNLTWHVTSFRIFSGCFRSDSSRAFECRSSLCDQPFSS